MGLLSSIASTAGAAFSIATSGSYDIDWKDPKVRDAVIVHWKEVKEKADAALPLAGLRLTKEQKAKLDELLKQKGVFPDEPTDYLLDNLPDAIPPASLNRIIGGVIDDCLKNHDHKEIPTISTGTE
ncbi:hypothetical protein LPJ77_003225 [Coemansia sp. RSA 2523]|nr:hypothetical protein LPJ54_004996 [Coemansia sp. RSA 1824]KAJ1776149.1 hypothetical protein LPJ62_006759 [Coemansia sp. RSA 2167]KAJ1780832.1 hypothetical protein LPJ67_005738 [Coemansia sp. RSA 1938]KAJ1807094.1 hypothetical protein LPJ77_003225 [Coemansia sp. RSA 2523]KAJ2147876.1 hypothetical protein IW142_001344 [Coemansia sp. RSA 564]KAJ2151032.1 hypothetical protein J3F82_003606 [Coemansia sp. RSA 637]KAJ2181058.1 hypothetical protein GGF45_001707 [Coemansia sp. RSA 551]KAJ2187074.1